MSKNGPPDVRGIPWPYEVLIEDLSDHYFLLRGTGCSLEFDTDTESQVNVLLQEDIQFAGDELPFDWNYPLDWKSTHQIEQASASTLDRSSWPWVNAREVSQCEYPDFDASGEYSLEDSIINGILRIVDSDDEEDDIPTCSSPSTNYGTIISAIDTFSGSSHWTKLGAPISGSSQIGLDRPRSDAEYYRHLNRIFSPRPYIMPFPVITMETFPTQRSFCESPESSHSLFQTSLGGGESCRGVFLSPRRSAIDLLPHSNSYYVPQPIPVMLTPKPRYPLPTWFN